MFARGSNGDADHRGTDLEADIFSNATSNFRSDEAAGSRANVGAKHVSYDTTYCVSVVSTNRPAVGGTDTSTFSSANIVTDCPADRGADASTVSSTYIVTDCPADSGADASTFSAADCVAYYPANGLADIGADSGASTDTNTGTNRGAVATTLSAADDSVSNSETFATTLIATDGAADCVSDGAAFFDANNGADGTAIAPANYFAANHVTATYSNSDHEYAYDVNSDVRALGLAVISSGAKPYGAALQHADDRSAVATAVAAPDGEPDEPPVAAAEPCSLGNSDCEPDGRADSPPIDLARTDHFRSLAVADSLANSVDRAHAPRTSRSAGEHHSGSGYVGRDLDGRGLRRRS